MVSKQKKTRRFLLAAEIFVYIVITTAIILIFNYVV
jgi:hypothetical protein